MNNNNVPIVEPIVDYTKIPPIHQRRTISFINHFIVTTVSFLNKFALNCEDKLYEFENKLQKLEAAIVILESRLSSVPSLENKVTSTKNCHERLYEKAISETDEQTMNIEMTHNIDERITTKVQTADIDVINKHPLYEKYFKMISVGVPKPAVKIKMAQEGLDPSLLDDSHELLPTSSSITEI